MKSTKKHDFFGHTPAIYTIDIRFLCHIGVQKPGPQYSPAIYTMDIACKIDIPL